MSGRLEAVCVSGADLLPLPGRRPSRSGIDKQPVTGRVAVGPLGLDGDTQSKHPPPHRSQARGGPLQEGEDADWWSAGLGRDLPPGRFGENLRTTGLDLTGALVGERWQLGTALVEVTCPRIPCANLARFWDVPQLVRRFTARGTTGAYLRVVEPGDVAAGDDVEVALRPDHGITLGQAFRALTTQKHRLPELAPVLHHFPVKDRAGLGATIATRTAAAAARTG